MGRYDVFQNPSARTRDRMPLLLDVQAEVFADLDSRVVVPLAPERPGAKAPRGLQPRLIVGGRPMIMLTPLVAALPRSALGPFAGNLAEDGPEILRALDLLLTGA